MSYVDYTVRNGRKVIEDNKPVDYKGLQRRLTLFSDSEKYHKE